MGTRIVYEAADGGMTQATLGGLYITIFRRDFTPEEMGHMRTHQIAFARDLGVQFPILNVLDVNEMHLLRLSKPAREASVAVARETASLIRCSAIVFDRGGFAASALRSLVTTVNLLAKQPYPNHVFGDLQAAMTWIDGKVDKKKPSDFDQTTILASVRALRSRSPAIEAPSNAG